MMAGNHTGRSLNGCPIGSCPADERSTGRMVPRVKFRHATVNSASARLSSAREGGAVLPAPLNCRRGLSALAFASAAFFAFTAQAGGIGPHTAPDDPCPEGVMVNDGSMTAEMFAQFVAVRAMSCGDVEFERPAFFDRKTGERLTDAEILRRVFNGSDVSVIPLPAGVWLLLAGVGALAWVRRK